MNEPRLIEARGIVHDYPGPVRALAGLDFDLAAGEFVGVVGPNGSGKSTLLRVLGGLAHPSAGRVLLAGRPVRDHAPRERARHVACVPQFLPALPDVRVRDFVATGRYARQARLRPRRPEDARAVEDALAACDVSDLGQRALTELSGGQRQRVLVARAIAQDAPILLVDEPTNALDPEHQIAVFELLDALRARGRAVVVVTHDLNLAGQFATRLCLLEAGRVARDGAPELVLARAVLEPVYGAHLHYGTWSAGAARGRPFVVPCRAP